MNGIVVVRVGGVTLAGCSIPKKSISCPWLPSAVANPSRWVSQPPLGWRNLLAINTRMAHDPIATKTPIVGKKRRATTLGGSDHFCPDSVWQEEIGRASCRERG